MKKYYTEGIILIIIFAVIFIAYSVFSTKSNIDTVVKNTTNTVTVKNTIYRVSIADTQAKQTEGLSGAKVLQKDRGLLFVFKKSGVYSFWMKDMNFPIDIIWIDKNFKIVFIKKNATPSSFPELFNTRVKAKYALEINKGEVGKNKIKIGDSVVLHISNTEL